MSDISERFWRKVDKRGPDDCWEWQAGKSSFGYGAFGINGRSHRAHRVAKMLSGVDLGDQIVRHACDNPACCNPAHLLLGTLADNNRDMWERNRASGTCAANAAKTHCPKGHPLSGENLHISPRGLRICQECNRQRYWDRKAKAAIRKGEAA